MLIDWLIDAPRAHQLLQVADLIVSPVQELVLVAFLLQQQHSFSVNTTNPVKPLNLSAPWNQSKTILWHYKKIRKWRQPAASPSPWVGTHSFLPSLTSCLARSLSFCCCSWILFWYCRSLSRCCFSCCRKAKRRDVTVGRRVTVVSGCQHWVISQQQAR